MDIAESLTRKGAAAVIVNYSRSADEARATAERLEDLGCEAEAVAADVSDDAAVRRTAERVRAAHGRVDALVCNAGTTRWVPFPDLEGLTDQVWRRLMGVNLMGPFYCARAFAPDLRAARGAIVNAASIAGPRATGSSWHIDRVGEQVFSEMAAKEELKAPLRRTARPEHVAQMVTSLLESDLVTGETLIGDGGRHLGY
ncbi:SDR family oxidoreductase [Nonomuraea maheshkhaliensis]|uniref:SDR family oxidoreductase n=1 Tax=Nonomuraea maheshkhaliensis TaxID=419590 RepID=A0ABN2FGU3_9ACTN